MMQILMDEDIAKFTLKEANDARKIVAKKQMARIPELHEKVNKAIPDPTAASYIWRVAVAPQLGYAFSLNHSLPYSFVGIQMLKLALDWSPVYWNTACLIVNSGAIDPEAGGQTDYGKIAKAVNDLQERGITIRPVNINSSEYGFAPDEKNNAIYFGLKGLLSVGDDVVSSILANRPYASFEDFMQRCPLNKSPMVSLIKAGAFDDFGERRRIMALYLWRKMKKKNEINMRNMAGLIREGLLPAELNDQRKIFEFNRYLKDKCAGDENNFWLDERAIKFLQNHFMIDVGADGEHITLNMKKWDKQYQAEMDVVREWMKSHQEDLIYQLNRQEFMNEWNKYAQGTLSAWEMEVMCFYYHEHELKHINRAKYGIANYFELPDEPRVEKIIRGHIPLYKLTRICGTVIAKNKTKGDVTLLTPEGVVNVWFRKEYFALFDRQISARGADGKKHVIEKSWFQRGSKIMVTGMRRGEEFIPKKYASTPGHQLYKILSIDDNGFVHNVSFLGGCNGNLKAIGKLVEGMKAEKVIEILEGNTCGSRPTSCADQLAQALKENL
jgi:DNA polymerase-3 subunit alpha